MASPKAELPSPLLKHVYFEHVRHFGEPSRSIRFGDGSARHGEEHIPSLIDVMIWEPDDTVDMTTFATIGMAEKPMIGARHRAELHHAIRGPVGEAVTQETSRFLANLTAYPFIHETFFDWWHGLSAPGDVPFFPAASAVLLHPRFVENGWDRIAFEEIEVKLLNVIPITRREQSVKQAAGVDGLLDYFHEHRIDLFAPRE